MATDREPVQDTGTDAREAAMARLVAASEAHDRAPTFHSKRPDDLVAELVVAARMLRFKLAASPPQDTGGEGRAPREHVVQVCDRCGEIVDHASHFTGPCEFAETRTATVAEVLPAAPVETRDASSVTKSPWEDVPTPERSESDGA